MKTKIAPIPDSKTIDYGDELVENFWQLKVNRPDNQPLNVKLEALLQNTQQGFICLQSESLSDKRLIKQIFDISQNLPVRFYILVNNYTPELDILNEICLIRHDASNKGSFMLANPNSNQPAGVFFTGQLSEQSIANPLYLCKNLVISEIEDLYRHFCFHFWETAKKERISKGQSNNINTKPLDVFHDANAFQGRDFTYSTVLDFTLTQNRRDLLDKKILFLNKESQTPVQIKANTTIDLGNNTMNSLLPKNEFEAQRPNFNDDERSISIEYKWQNIPFYLPENASEHVLYSKWNKKQEEIINKLDSILKKINEMENKENTLSKAISRLMLGKKSIFNSLKSEIEDFKQADFSTSSGLKLKEDINRINAINNQVQNDINEIEVENRNAKLDEEISGL